jgi:hypothetical protein
MMVTMSAIRIKWVDHVGLQGHFHGTRSRSNKIRIGLVRDQYEFY